MSMDFGDSDATLSSPYHWVRLLSVTSLIGSNIQLA